MTLCFLCCQFQKGARAARGFSPNAAARCHPQSAATGCSAVRRTAPKRSRVIRNPVFLAAPGFVDSDRFFFVCVQFWMLFRFIEISMRYRI